MKKSIVIGRIAKVSAVVAVTTAITWQAHQQKIEGGFPEQSVLTQEASFLPQPWAEHRKTQVKELSRSMPNRFTLSKAYYGKEDALLEAAELRRLKTTSKEQIVKLPES